MEDNISQLHVSLYMVRFHQKYFIVKYTSESCLADVESLMKCSSLI